MNDFYSGLFNWNRALAAQMSSYRFLTEGVYQYNSEFINPLMTAATLFYQLEAGKVLQRDPLESADGYARLLAFNNDLMSRYGSGCMEIMSTFLQKEIEGFLSAWPTMLQEVDGEGAAAFFEKQEETFRRVVRDYPRAIRDIEGEFGFHFENHPQSLVGETDRFELRQITPTAEGVETDDRLKPILIIPPFVLGANILAFLPQQQKSYAHTFANKGIPTYIRLMKDIHSTPAVQTMSMENDVEDIRFFSKKLLEKHGRRITLNGYCQGGFSSVCALLTGRLDGLVDALITCVAPMDGTRSQGLGDFLRDLPPVFNDLDYGTKTLANGNRIADGNLMGWIYKLKSIENSGPLLAMFRDIMMLDPRQGRPKEINKTVAALNYWLQNERSDLPLAVTEMSFASYNHPITEDGTLPVSIFGKKLNFKALREKNIPWLLCYGESDDLVEKEVALAPLDHVEAEVTPFPKGHVAIATSWSHPDSACALDSIFGKGNYRGPVRFHLDLSDTPVDR